MSEDITDPARLPGKFIPSFRGYAPDPDDLSRDEVQSRLSAAERLDVRKLLDRDDAFVELDDSETVAAGVMLTLVAADLYAPASGGLTDRIRSFRVPNPMNVGGLDLARRADFSALVTLEVATDRLTVTRALRLSQDRYNRQLAAVAPILADLDAPRL